MVTKIQLINLCEEAISGKGISEFVGLMAEQYQRISQFMEEDSNFNASFRMSCVRLANVSSYLYHFLAGLQLVTEDRPTSFPTIVNLLHVVTSNKRQHRMMSALLMKVIMFFIIVTSRVHALDYNIEITTGHLLLTTHVDTTEYSEITEEFTLEPIFEQMKKINNSLKLIEGLMKFDIRNRDCSSVGNQNSNTDDIQELVAIAKDRNITRLRMQTYENEADHKFIGFLINNDRNISCVLTNSLKRVQYLLAQNTFRTQPTTKQQMTNYRDGMLTRFRDHMERSCIRQGAFPDSFVTHNFTVSEPRIENCAAVCYFQNSNFLEARKNNRISMIKLKTSNCQAWSFNIKTGICQIIEKISNEDFIGKISWRSPTNIYVMSGLSSCQPRNFYDSIPKIFANEKLIGLQQMCNFSAVNLVFEHQVARCKNLYFKLHSPIEKKRTELAMFMVELVKQHKIKKIRAARSVVGSTMHIAKALLTAANTIEESVLQNVIDTVTKTSVGLLHNLSQKITAAGIHNKVVHRQNQKASINDQTLDIDRILMIARSWQGNYNRLTLIKHNYDVFINQLLTGSHNLEKYFIELFSNEGPIKPNTVDFIGNTTYIFSSYLKENKIIRQFIKTKKSTYSALQSTVVPIRKETFFQNYFWQSDLFMGKNFKRSNQCLILLMQESINEKTMEICKAAPKLEGLEKWDDNIFSIQQQVKNVIGRVVVANVAAVFEIRCKKGQLVKSTRGLSVFLMSNDCSFTYSGQIIIQPELNVEGFKPRFVFGLNETLIKPSTIGHDWHKIVNSLMTTVIGAFVTIILVIICIRCSFSRTEVQYNYVSKNESELEPLS